MDQTGKEYYYNKEMNISQWVHPTAADNQQGNASIYGIRRPSLQEQQRMNDLLPTPIIVSSAEGIASNQTLNHTKQRILQESTGVSAESDPFGLRLENRFWNVRVWEYEEAETGEFPSFDWQTNSFLHLGDEPVVTYEESKEIMYEHDEWTEKVKAPPYYFAAVCSSKMRVCEKGSYTFWTESDDGSNLYVEDNEHHMRLVVKNGGVHEVRRREGKLDLLPGFHFILVQFFQYKGGATLKVTYSGPDTGGKEQPVRLDLASDPLWSSPRQLQDIIKRFPQAAQVPGPYKRLPLHWASVSGSAAGVTMLLNAFPEAAKMADEDGRLPLHVAAESNPNKEVIEVLLKAYPDAASTMMQDQNLMQDKIASLPYQVAEKNNNTQAVTQILKAACWEPILIHAEICGFEIGTTGDEILEDTLRRSGDAFKSVLQRDRPLMASLYLSTVLARFSRRQRSVDMEVASMSDDRAVALEQLASFVVRDLISWCSLFRKFEGYRDVLGDEKGATVVLDSGLQYSSNYYNYIVSGELDSDTNSTWAWRPAYNKHDQYFQMDTGRVTKIRGVVTRGGDNSWVTSYRIKYSNDLQNWETVECSDEQRAEIMKSTGLGLVGKNDDGAEVKVVLPFCSLVDCFPDVYGRDTDPSGRRSTEYEGYNPGEVAKFCCGRELPRMEGQQCGPQGQCMACKEFQDSLCDGNSDPDTPVAVVFIQQIEARYVRIFPQTWERNISMRAGLLIDAAGYVEKEVDEALEFMVKNKLKTILSDAVCVRIVMEKWNGRPWKGFFERFETIVGRLGSKSEFFGSLWTRMGGDEDTNLCVKILGYIARIMVGVILFVIFWPYLLGALIIEQTGPYSVFDNEHHHGGVKILATVLLLLSFWLVVPYLIVGALIAFLSFSWPPFWSFLLHKTTYVGFCVIIWYLPRLEEEDIGAEPKNLALEVAAALLLVSFLWDESAQLINLGIKSFSRGENASDLKANIYHTEQLVTKAKAQIEKAIKEHFNKAMQILQTLFSEDGCSQDDAQILQGMGEEKALVGMAIIELLFADNVVFKSFSSDELRKKDETDIDTITENVIKRVTNVCNSVSKIPEKKKAAKKLASEIEFLKKAKTKKTHDLDFGEQELLKAENAKKQYEDKQKKSFKRLNDILHSLGEVMLWYTNDIWNCIDLVSHLVALVAGITRGCLYAGVPNLEPTAVAQLHMWAVLLLWARLVSILHVSSFLGPLLHIVEVMLTKDVPQFLVLSVLMMVPFVGSLSHRFGDDCSVESKTCKDLKIEDFNGFLSAGGSFLKMFADAGKGAPLELVDGSWGLQELFILYAAYILLLIALVNLLIAQFSKTFDTVFENSTKEYLLRRAELLMEWKHILYPAPFNVVAVLWCAALWLLSHCLTHLRRAVAGDTFEQEWLDWPQLREETEKSFHKHKWHSRCKCSNDHQLKMSKKIDVHLQPGTIVEAKYTDDGYGYYEAKIVRKNNDGTYDIEWTDGDIENTKGKTYDQLKGIGFSRNFRCDVCKQSYTDESRLRCDKCDYDVCKVCVKNIVEHKDVRLKFNFKSLVRQKDHQEWRQSLLRNFEEKAEFGSEAQMEKFKGVMLKAKNKTQAKLENLERKIEGIEQLLQDMAQKFASIQLL